jgi:hypothetical protein
MRDLPGKANPIGRVAIALGYAFLGWGYCGAIIGIGRQLMSMRATLILHAIGAPVGFALLSFCYFRQSTCFSPMRAALLFLAVVIGMDVFVVAPFVEKSFEMFFSPLGTWLPLALIFVATYLVGAVMRRRRGQPMQSPLPTPASVTPTPGAPVPPPPGQEERPR